MGRVDEIFLTQSILGKKNSTQPNPSYKSNLSHMGGLGRVKPMGWTIFFITIIIKLNKKNISYLPLELINKIYINI